MSSYILFLRSALAITACLLMTACSDVGGSASLAPTGPAAGFASDSGPEYANVSNQGGGGVYATNGARLVRQPDGLRVSVTMPTPQPGTYNYPVGKVEGDPEVFTLWVFVFNYPNLCSGPCDMNDIGNTPAKGGVYNGGGHVASGNSMTIAGRVGVAEAPFGGVPLESPGTAAVHLAIAPHGDLNPASLPGEFRSPTGPPPLWWVALFP